MSDGVSCTRSPACARYTWNPRLSISYPVCQASSTPRSYPVAVNSTSSTAVSGWIVTSLPTV